MNVEQWSTIEKKVSLMTEGCCELWTEAGPNIQDVAQFQFLVLVGIARNRVNDFPAP